jgi:hypothetical protein
MELLLEIISYGSVHETTASVGRGPLTPAVPSVR